MKEVFEFLKKCNTYYLATAEADGQPPERSSFKHKKEMVLPSLFYVECYVYFV